MGSKVHGPALGLTLVMLAPWPTLQANGDAAPDPAGEGAYEFETVEVDAEREMEIAYLAIRDALQRPRSTRPEDADLLVCQRVSKPAHGGSLLKEVRCTSNAGWWYERKESMHNAAANLSRVMTSGGVARHFAEVAFRAGARAPYAVRRQPAWTLSLQHFRELEARYGASAGAEPQRLADLVTEHRVAGSSDEFGTPARTVTRFAQAFAAVREAGADEARAAAAVQAAGFTPDEYNALVTRLETSASFRHRVSVALELLSAP